MSAWSKQLDSTQISEQRLVLVPPPTPLNTHKEVPTSESIHCIIHDLALFSFSGRTRSRRRVDLFCDQLEVASIVLLRLSEARTNQPTLLFPLLRPAWPHTLDHSTTFHCHVVASVLSACACSQLHIIVARLSQPSSIHAPTAYLLPPSYV